MLKSDLEVLHQCPLFEGLDDGGIIDLMPCFSPVLREFKKGELLCQAGSPQDSIGIVLSGEIQVQKDDVAGNRLIVGVFGAGELFGEVSAFAGFGSWPNNVTGGTDGCVLFFPYDKISSPCCKACGFHQTMIRNMLHIVAGKAMIMNSRLNYLKLRSMREKLAAFLVDQYRLKGSKTFYVTMNRDQLADFLNVSRPSMSRELGRMKDEGIIDFYRSSFTIKDLDALREIGL